MYWREQNENLLDELPFGLEVVGRHTRWGVAFLDADGGLDVLNVDIHTGVVRAGCVCSSVWKGREIVLVIAAQISAKAVCADGRGRLPTDIPALPLCSRSHSSSRFPYSHT